MVWDLNRTVFTNREIYGMYYFFKQRTPVNEIIISKMMGIGLIDYLNFCQPLKFREHYI